MPAMNLITGFLHVQFDELSGFILGIATDLSDHDHRLGLRIFLEQRQHINKACANNRIAADPDAGRLSQSQRR